MINSIDWEFNNKYPKLYATAETYGFTKEDIEQMIINEIMLNEYCQKQFEDGNILEVALKTLMVRLDVPKEQFRKTIIELANKKTEDELKEIVGWRQVNIVYALAGLD